jgi:hypothetical protein
MRTGMGSSYAGAAWSLIWFGSLKVLQRFLEVPDDYSVK